MLNHCEIMEVGKAIFLSYIDGLPRSGKCPDTGRVYRVFRRHPNWADQRPVEIEPGKWY